MQLESVESRLPLLSCLEESQLRMAGTNKDAKCRLVCAMGDPDFSEGRMTSLLEGYWLGDDLDEGAENSCLWIQTAKGYVAKWVSR